jgi:hypothetical protein
MFTHSEKKESQKLIKNHSRMEWITENEPVSKVFLKPFFFSVIHFILERFLIDFRDSFLSLCINIAGIYSNICIFLVDYVLVLCMIYGNTDFLVAATLEHTILVKIDETFQPVGL